MPFFFKSNPPSPNPTKNQNATLETVSTSNRSRETEKTKANKKKSHIPKLRDRSPTSTFSDGRPIDIVLSYRPMDPPRKKRAVYAKYRRKFEGELRSHGMELEYENRNLSRDGNTAYVKIHAPFDVLARQAELRRLRKPTHVCDLPNSKENERGFYRRIFHDPFRLQDELRYPFKDYFTEPFHRRNLDSYIGCIGPERDTFFTPAERAYLTWDAMKNVLIDVKRKKNLIDQPLVNIGVHALNPVGLGKRLLRLPNEMPRMNSATNANEKSDLPGTIKANIDYLLDMNVYESAYALHDSDLNDSDYENKKKKPSSRWPLRVYLFEAWVRPRQLFRHQPLDAIRDYYGERVALYFAWLGFYTKMLILPALVGCLVMLYGAAVATKNEVVKQTCHNRTIGDWILCRDCPNKACDFHYLSESCSEATYNEIFDNEVTVFFSLFIAIWAVFLIAFWKRYAAELAARWNMPEHEDETDDTEQPRPEYETIAQERKRNPITGKIEPFVPVKVKVKRVVASILTVSFCIIILIGLIMMISIYRVIGPDWWYKELNYTETVDVDILTSVTGAIATGIFIGIMSKIFQHLAGYLTRLEYPRTDKEYEHSYSYKVLIFECLNNYGALFYLAFMHGQLPPPPHEQGDYESRCAITGCLVDLVIQLAIIYCGRQLVDTFISVIIPTTKALSLKFVKIVLRRTGEKDVRWVSDHDLQPDPRVLWSDSLRLFIQYGYVTMFVPAFPLAPLFALLNNIMQIRLNAYKVLFFTRRCPPIPIRQGVDWSHMVRIMTKVAILTNALLIAFTSDFIPRILYVIDYGGDWRLKGYLEFILSEFDTRDWRDVNNTLTYWFNETNQEHMLVEKCYYRDFRQSPWKKDPHGLPSYGLRKEWWHVLVTRLAFIVIFEHFIFLLQSFIEYMIPAVPTRILRRRRREEHLQRERFMQGEGIK